MPIPVTRLRAEPYSLTFYSGMGQRARLVIRDQATWQATWAKIWNVTPPPPLPTVDFGREMIVVAALGERATGGYGILVDSARRTTSGVVVRIRTFSPGSSCFTTQAFTQPVDAARLPLIDAPVAFVDAESVVNCR